MAFPGAGTIDAMRRFLWEALVKTSCNQWDALQCVPLPEASAPRWRALSAVGTTAAIALPLIVAAALLFAFHDGGAADLRRNAAMTLEAGPC
ncbi:MAG TPA: hypothetical protein VKT72_08540 [Candidatus Baltobacteraceae bacterium]|nr:hypothetical protein [Candidatus Baltobacteraceae bacterium]